MFDLLTPHIRSDAHIAPIPLSYQGPERRGGMPSVVRRWLAAMLDEIDYGMLLLIDENRVVHANHAARAELDADHPLQLLGDELRLRHGQDVAPLCDALAAASRRGLRKLLTLGEAPNRISVAVVPLPAFDPQHQHATLLVFGKRQMCEELSVHWFAQAHGLTIAETQVLKALCTGAQPSGIAKSQGVAISTVRTQISSIRSKTGAASIRDLVRQVAVLPPLVSTLREASSWSRATSCQPS